MARTRLWTGGAAVATAGMVAIGGGLMIGSGPADDPKTARPEAAPASALADLGWLAGAYAQTNERGVAEEHWSAPHGNSIMGMFRWCKPDGTPAMFEILTITREGEGDGAKTLLRLRHFSPTLVGKEEKDKPMTLVLESGGPGRAVFVAHENAGDLARIVYHAPDPGKLDISVEFREDLKRGPLTFSMARRDR